MNALRTLLHQIVDYAGLFPPATLDMRETVTNYAAYRVSANAWALGRLIVPVSRLGEFESTILSLPLSTVAGGRWRLSVLVGDQWKDDAARIEAFNDRWAGRKGIAIDTVEFKAPDPSAISRVKEMFRAPVSVFVEIPIDGDPRAWVGAIADAGAFAKARTGGIQESMFPTTSQIVRFMERCCGRRVAFKVTAGLHHALRSTYRLTYDSDSPRGTMHGFLNVFLAAGFLASGLDPGDVAAIIEESSPDAFAFADDSVSWRSHRLDTDAIARMRRDFARAFGSCSFEEPIDELKGMNLL